MKEKECPNCGKDFQGRRNKKFCSVSCKNEFHNKAYRDANQMVFNINKILTKNRTILKNLFDIYRSTPISMDVLTAHGFKSKYHTHLFNAPNGSRYTMIYEIGYKSTLDNQVQIVELDKNLVLAR